MRYDRKYEYDIIGRFYEWGAAEMCDKNSEYSIIDEIYLENEDRLRECKLEQVMLQVDIKNSVTMLQQEEEKKDPNRGIFHTVDSHVFDDETDRMRKALFIKKEQLAAVEVEIATLEDRKQRLHEVKKALYSDILLKDANVREDDNSQSLRLLMMQEQERNRIAADLHDSTVQSMTALVHKVELIEHLLDIDRTRAFVELSGMKDTVRSMIQEMREIIYDLRPMSLENLGLWMAAKEMLGLVQERHNIQTQFLADDSVLQYKPDELVEINLFRMIQEAVNNSVKHANATVITVAAEINNKSLFVTISDDGVGMCEADQKKDRSFGLHIMRERANIIHASFEIHSENGGTKVEVMIPLAE